jgi:thiol:disulfide interchange protein
VVAALYTDVHPQYREVQNKRFKSISLPLYVVLGPDGKERSRLEGRITLNQFLDFLKKGQETASGIVHPTLEPALAEARSSRRPVFVEFAVLRPESIANKERILKRGKVKDLLRKYVVAELWTDLSRENRALLSERFHTISAPFYVTLGPEGEERSRLQGMATEADFLAFLEKGLAVASK